MYSNLVNSMLDIFKVKIKILINTKNNDMSRKVPNF